MIVVGSACFVDGFERMARKSAYFVEEWMVIEKGNRRKLEDGVRSGYDLHDLMHDLEQNAGFGGPTKLWVDVGGGSVSSRHVLQYVATRQVARGLGSFVPRFIIGVSVFTLQVSPHARPDRVVQRKIRISCILT